MRHRFYLEDDLIKIGWGADSALAEWDSILAWVVRTLDDQTSRLHVLIDFSELYHITEEVFPPEMTARLAAHPNAGCLMLVSQNPIFVYFVNTHWVTQSESAVGLRAFLDASDALTWLRQS